MEQNATVRQYHDVDGVSNITLEIAAGQPVQKYVQVCLTS